MQDTKTPNRTNPIHTVGVASDDITIKMGLSNSLPAPTTPQVFSTSCFPKQFRSEASVYIGRKGPWGNPFTIGIHGTRDEVIARYREYILDKVGRDHEFKALFATTLSGKHLVCHCKPLACHGDVILEVLQLIALTKESPV